MTGAEYRAAREALGLTQDALAKRLGISRRKIVRLETRGTVPKSDAYALNYLRTRERDAVNLDGAL